jgi:hypothetical protein
METRNPYARRHPWLIALGILGGAAFLFVAVTVVLFVVALGSGQWG